MPLTGRSARVKAVSRAVLGPTAWDAVVESSPDAWVWALWDWQELIEGVPRWHLRDVGFALVDDHAVLAVVPLHWIPENRRLSGSGFGLTSPAIIEAPAERRDQIATAVFEHVGAIAQRLGARRVEFAQSPVSRTALASPGHDNPFVRHGYQDESGYARVLDLEPDEAQIFAGFSRDARQQVRKALAAGFTARAVNWQTALDDYYRLHCETYARTGQTPHMREYFAGIAARLAPRGYSNLIGVFGPDGLAVAFHNTARLGVSGLYHTGCSNAVALRTGANYLAFWEAIRQAKQHGCRWYEIGEVFPGHQEGKARGLTVFKSKFGGEVRRSWRAALELPSQVPSPDPDAVARTAYREGDLYAPSRICARLDAGIDDYTTRLLHDKMTQTLALDTAGVVVDLCCGAGAHALHVARSAAAVVGIDYSPRYLGAAAAEVRAQSLNNVSLVCADAKRVPLVSDSVRLLYCFSALYAISDAAEVIAEVGRVLTPDGHAVLDFGNRRSLNVFCLRYYPEWPPIQPMTLGEIHRSLESAGLRIVRHRSYQLLPLWAGRPRWLWPLLHPAWKALLQRRWRGRMLDEWISSLPIFRAFAFRHVMVCRKETV